MDSITNCINTISEDITQVRIDISYIIYGSSRDTLPLLYLTSVISPRSDNYVRNGLFELMRKSHV
jgi:hypothetical protein